MRHKKDSELLAEAYSDIYKEAIDNELKAPWWTKLADDDQKSTSTGGSGDGGEDSKWNTYLNVLRDYWMKYLPDSFQADAASDPLSKEFDQAKVSKMTHSGENKYNWDAMAQFHVNLQNAMEAAGYIKEGSQLNRDLESKGVGPEYWGGFQGYA